MNWHKKSFRIFAGGEPMMVVGLMSDNGLWGIDTGQSALVAPHTPYDLTVMVNGFLLAAFSNIEHCNGCAADIEPLADWRNPAGRMRFFTPDQEFAVKAVIAQYGGER